MRHRTRPALIESGSLRRAGALAAALLLAGSAAAAPDAAPPRAPVADFVPPRAGTYSLQRIQACPQAVLLDQRGRARRLSELTRGQITLLSFFYTHCSDPLGCPFAVGLMAGLRDRIASDSELAGRVRFVSISFDPIHDSPQRLRDYAGTLPAGGSFEWDFLTAPSMARLQPFLQDLGQDVRVEPARDGQPERVIHHMLKLFLIDTGGTVREIYALDYLQPEVMLNDMRTLHREALPKLAR